MFVQRIESTAPPKRREEPSNAIQPIHRLLVLPPKGQGRIPNRNDLRRALLRRPHLIIIVRSTNWASARYTVCLLPLLTLFLQEPERRNDHSSLYLSPGYKSHGAYSSPWTQTTRPIGHSVWEWNLRQSECEFSYRPSFDL